MKDYSKGKIYKLEGNGYVYYGSTCEPILSRRKAKHRSNYNDYVRGKGHYVTSYKCFANGYDPVIIPMWEQRRVTS